MTNKLRTLGILACSGLLFAASPVFAQGVILGSKHDFTASGSAQATTTETAEICVFCHTPHAGDTSAPVPLWNKVITTRNFNRYSELSTPTFDSREAPVGSVSLACLSCHDGVQAMDVVLNEPGSGLGDVGQIDPNAIGPMAGTPVPVIASAGDANPFDLSNDHPVSMQYGGGGAISTDPDGPFTGTLGDPDFNAPIKTTLNTKAIWWVDSASGEANTREKTDMLLYTRNDLGSPEPFVECGSCHDPHNGANASGTQVQFLRTSNVGSAICTACHVK